MRAQVFLGFRTDRKTLKALIKSGATRTLDVHFTRDIAMTGGAGAKRLGAGVRGIVGDLFSSAVHDEGSLLGTFVKGVRRIKRARGLGNKRDPMSRAGKQTRLKGGASRLRPPRGVSGRC
jgi:hypothetical protein